MSPEGELIRSWGEPGDGPGEFHVVHSVHVSRGGRVLVCDRDNERITPGQASHTGIDSSLKCLTHPGRQVRRPMDRFRSSDRRARGTDGLIYVAEQDWKMGHGSFKRGKIERPEQEMHGRTSLRDGDSRVLERSQGQNPCAPANFVAPHGLAIDSHGDIYVGKVNWTVWGRFGRLRSNCHTFQKFARSRGI
jgi:hypothetical protein